MNPTPMCEVCRVKWKAGGIGKPKRMPEALIDVNDIVYDDSLSWGEMLVAKLRETGGVLREDIHIEWNVFSDEEGQNT